MTILKGIVGVSQLVCERHHAVGCASWWILPSQLVALVTVNARSTASAKSAIEENSRL